MSILISVTEKRNPQILHDTPIAKLYGVPFINTIRANGVESVVELSGKRNLEERELSESYSTINGLANKGYIDFVIPVTVKSVSGNQNDSYPYSFSIKASSIVEVYADPNESADSIIRVRDDKRQEDTFYTVDETIAAIQLLIPVAAGGVLSFERTLTQAEVRTLNTANGSYGIKLLDAVTDNVIQITNPVIVYKATGGTYATADIWLYDDSVNTPLYLGVTTFGTITPKVSVEALNLEEDAYIEEGDIFIYSTVEQVAFEGTWVVRFDYKYINIS